jgi:hypothetical protein
VKRCFEVASHSKIVLGWPTSPKTVLRVVSYPPNKKGEVTELLISMFLGGQTTLRIVSGPKIVLG